MSQSTQPEKRVVSKRTKLLFIAFGAMSIATASIVASAEMDREFSEEQPACRQICTTPEQV